MGARRSTRRPAVSRLVPVLAVLVSGCAVDDYIRQNGMCGLGYCRRSCLRRFLEPWWSHSSAMHVWTTGISGTLLATPVPGSGFGTQFVPLSRCEWVGGPCRSVSDRGRFWIVGSPSQ